MGNKKNIKLLLVLVGLSVLTAFIYLYDGSANNGNFNPNKFMVADTAAVNKVVLKKGAVTNILTEKSGDWTVNGKYPADPNLGKLVKAVLKLAVVKRKAPKSSMKKISEQLKSDDVLVEVYGDDAIITSFYAGGNDNKTTSYFMEVGEEQPYIMAIPGYSSYISGIFAFDESGWRDKTIFSTFWQVVVSLSVDFPSNPQHSFEMKRENNFLTVGGIKNMDTAKVVNYVRMYERFTAVRFIQAGTSSVYDSLLGGTPVATVTLKDIDLSKSRTLEIYPFAEADNNVLGLIKKENQMVLIQKNKVFGLLQQKGFFKKD